MITYKIIEIIIYNTNLETKNGPGGWNGLIFKT